MKNNFSIIERDEAVSICNDTICTYYSAFIDIFIDDGDFHSPFKNIEDAVLFAEIVVKLLEVITDGTG